MFDELLVVPVLKVAVAVVAGGSGAALFFKLPTLAAAATAAAAAAAALTPDGPVVVTVALLFFLLVKTDRLLVEPAIKTAAVLTADPLEETACGGWKTDPPCVE